MGGAFSHATADNVAGASALQLPGFGFNKPGNILIADQFNNRVIEAKPDGTIVWQFGLGPNDFSPQSIIGCNDAQRVGPFTLMAELAHLRESSPGTDGAMDNRVVLGGSYRTYRLAIRTIWPGWRWAMTS